MKAVKKIFKHWEMFLLVFLILEFVIFGAVNPKFLRPQSIMNSIVNYISVCIIALFVTLVMITGGIDIQAASIIGLTSIIQGYLWSDLGLNIWTSVLLAIIVAAICGGLSGFFIAYCGVQPMVVTLGGSFLYSGLALLVSGMSATPAYQGISGFPSKTEDGAFVDYRFLGKGELLGVPMPIVIYLVLIVLCIWLLHRTKYGERLYLIGVNQQAAEYSGINTPPCDHEHLRALRRERRAGRHDSDLQRQLRQVQPRLRIHPGHHHRRGAGRHAQYRRQGQHPGHRAGVADHLHPALRPAPVL